MSKGTLNLWPSMKVEMHQDGQYVHSLGPDMDEKWTLIDKAGHGHFWHPNKANHYPTLVYVIDDEGGTFYDGDYREEYGPSEHLECPLCHEHIAPGTRPSQPVYVPGLRSYTLTVTDETGESLYSFGQSQWDTLNAAMVDVVHTTLADFMMSRKSR